MAGRGSGAGCGPGRAGELDGRQTTGPSLAGAGLPTGTAVKASAVVVMGLALVLLTVSTNSQSLSDRTRWVLLLSLIASIAAALRH